MIIVTWKIVSDSSCDLLPGALAAFDVPFETVPLKIRVGEHEFVDDGALDVADLLARMHVHKGPTSSACPSPEEWASAYREADNVIAFTITSALSGSYNSAIVARDMVLEQFPEKHIHVVDTLSTGGQMALGIQYAAALIEQGCSFEQLERETERYNSELGLLFCLASFENLVKNGRMNRLVGFMAGALGMRAVGRASEKGELAMLFKARGETRALAFMLEEMDRHKDLSGKPVIISHCQNPSAAALLRNGVLAKWPTAHVTIMETRGLTSYYAQREGLLVAY